MQLARRPLRNGASPLECAFAECEHITRSQAKNFSYGIRLLPPDKRSALAAVYAMARRIDDVGDGALPVEQKIAGLAALRAQVQRLAAGFPAPDDDPVLMAVEFVALNYPLPLGAFEELITGCERDCTGVSVETFDRLVEYCRLVAGSIGRLSLAIFGTSDLERATPLADAVGVALQLTNILRDVVEDHEMGRCYLPAEDLVRFGCPSDLRSRDLANFKLQLSKVVAMEAARAAEWYDRGLKLLPMLDRRSRACVSTMAAIYRRLLLRIQAEPSAVFTGRVSLTTSEKSWLAVRSLVTAKA
jgi:phytoene synthase